jgi:hypothetical protein
MEYLAPVVEGCQAAFRVNVDQARNIRKLTDDEFEHLVDTGEQAFRDLTLCFRSKDTDEVYSIVFTDWKPAVFDECLEPDVVITAGREILIDILDSDAKNLPVDLLGKELDVEGINTQVVVEGLGFLCYPSLLRIARSGVDPSSLLAEDADSIIMAAASDFVTNLVQSWVKMMFDSS